MQFSKTFSIITLRILHSNTGNSSSRYLYTNVGSSVRQKLSTTLRTPRGHHRIPILEGDLGQQQKDVQSDTPGTGSSKMRTSDRRQMRYDVSEQEELEDQLFNNQERRQQSSNLNLNDMLRKYNVQNPRRREARFDKTVLQNHKQDKKPTNSHCVGELEKETFNVLKSYSSKEKSAEAFNPERKLKYLKLNQSDPLYGDLRLIVSSSKRRVQKCKMVLEGKRLISDGLEAGLSLNTILFNRLNNLDELKFTQKVRLVQVASHVLQEWSKLSTCPGVIGIFDQPNDMTSVAIRNRTTPPLPITVICDNIREPNNLGSIIRSCAAIPVQSVVLLKGCAHPWDPKCLRGGAGAHFRINIVGPLAIDTLGEYVPANAHFLAADNAVDREDETFVARRYDEANYRDMTHVVLVIGGETHGISSDMRRFIRHFREHSIHRDAASYNVHIPMANKVESLNTASAVSVVLYEIRRQMCETEK